MSRFRTALVPENAEGAVEELHRTLWEGMVEGSVSVEMVKPLVYRATSTYEDVTLITTAYGRCYLENGLYLRFPPEMAIMEVYFRGEVYKVRPIKGGMCGIYKRGETEPYSTGRNVKEAVDNMIKDKSNDGCR